MGNETEREKIDVIRAELKELAEPEFARFSSGLLRKPGEERPTGSAAGMLGVRLPVLRKMSRRLTKQDWRGNLEALAKANREATCVPEGVCCFEEIMLWGFLIGCAGIEAKNSENGLGRNVQGSSMCRKKPAQESITLQEQFELIRQYVSVIDNWSLCDSFCTGLKFAGEYREETWEFIQPFLRSEKEYSIRFGLVMIINYFITEEYIDRLYGIFDRIVHEGYYVKMAVAWAVSVCYVKFPETARRYLEDNCLDDFTYNKALQKIVESRCVSDEVRAQMRGMKRRTVRQENAG